jgi:Fe-S oxidoreductase
MRGKEVCMPIESAAAYEKIRRLGSYVDHYEQRARLLRSGLRANVDAKAEYAVMTGCNPLFSLTAVKSFIDLLRYFGVRYTFLSKEVCCGRPLREGMFDKEPADAGEKRKYDDFIRESLLNNINQARELGAKTILNICPGCDMTWNLSGASFGINIIYYTEFLLGVYTKGILDKEIDFYEGCHRVHKLSPDSLGRGIGSAKELLSRIEGLKYNEISSAMCCRDVPQDIFATCRTDTLVTPSQCCYSLLVTARPEQGPRVKFLGEVLFEALRNHAEP